MVGDFTGRAFDVTFEPALDTVRRRNRGVDLQVTIAYPFVITRVRILCHLEL